MSCLIRIVNKGEKRDGKLYCYPKFVMLQFNRKPNVGRNKTANTAQRKFGRHDALQIMRMTHIALSIASTEIYSYDSYGGNIQTRP